MDPSSKVPCPPRPPPGSTGSKGSTALQPGDYDEKIAISTLKRFYTIHIPTGFDQAKTWPVVVLLHGRGGNGKQIAQSTGMSDKADAAGFIAVYPNALPYHNEPPSWNTEVNPTVKHDPHDDDIAFLTELLSKMKKELAVDPKRVYFVGFSSGANMSFRMGAQIADQIAAIGIASGTIGFYVPPNLKTISEIPAPSVPVPVLHLHGIADETIGYYGGCHQFGKCLSVAESTAFW